MFTGLVEETGAVTSLREVDGGEYELRVHAPRIGNEVVVGESVAINGCCLTVTAVASGELRFNLLAETLRVTNLREAKLVNLERALSASGRFGGHIVQGHIDCTALIQAFGKDGSDHRVEVQLPPDFSRYVVPKGSIAVDGISLTVAEVLPESFVVWIIPHTLAGTNLREARVGRSANLEFDLLAKYVERMLRTN
ncbi:MAG: riboflavin synthase [Chthoniobacter sp.]|jgi:riboflavin synthase|nr:riboflavin synthase [Chthoniobacter sp.]